MVGYKAVAVVVAATAVLAACDSSTASLEDHVVSQDAVSLDAATVALFLSPQTYTVPDGGGTGYVVLADPDGQWRAVEHAVMDQGSMVWNDTGLAYSDSEFDYFLNDSLTKVSSPKTNLQDGFYVLDDGTVVSILNEGYEGSPSAGYISQIVVTGGETAELHQVEGWHVANARCGNEIFGIGPQSGPYFEETRDDPSMVSLADPTLQPQMLTGLFPLRDGREEALGYRPAFDFSEDQRDLPCVDRTVSFLSSYANRDGDRIAAIVNWNVDTGEFQEHELTGGTFDTDDIALAQYGSGSMTGNQLQWLHRDGHLMATDIDSGQTTRLFDTGGRSTGADYSVALFAGDDLVVATVGTDSDAVVIKSFDRASADLSWSVELDNLTTYLGVDLVLRSIAISPGLV